MAVRAALGASRGALVKGSWRRASCLGLAGSALGWLLARAAVPALAAAIPDSQRAALPFLQDLRLDLGGAPLPALLAALTGVLFGLVPAALRSSRADLARSLRRGQRARERPASPGDAGAGADPGGAGSDAARRRGVFARSLARVLDVDPGFRPEGVVVGTLAFPNRSMSEAEASWMMDQVLASANGVPGVRATAATNLLPERPTPAGWASAPPAAAGPNDLCPTTGPSPPRASRPWDLRLPARGGCSARDDTAESPLVAVVNETFARLHFPVWIRSVNASSSPTSPIGEVFTVVGLVRDERLGPLDPGAAGGLYSPLHPEHRGPAKLSAGAPHRPGLAVVPGAPRCPGPRMDGELVLQSLQEMPRMLEDSPAVFGRRYPVWLLGLFAGCAHLCWRRWASSASSPTWSASAPTSWDSGWRPGPGGAR